MFVTKRLFNARIDYLERELAAMNDKYWRAYHDHRLLLEKLGLQEVVIPKKTVLREKGMPEQGDA